MLKSLNQLTGETKVSSHLLKIKVLVVLAGHSLLLQHSKAMLLFLLEKVSSKLFPLSNLLVACLILISVVVLVDAKVLLLIWHFLMLVSMDLLLSSSILIPHIILEIMGTALSMLLQDKRMLKLSLMVMLDSQLITKLHC